MGPKQCGIILAHKWGLAGEAFVDDTAQRIDIGTMGDWKTGDLLRRYVLNRADKVSSGRKAWQTGQALCQPEIAEVDVALSEVLGVTRKQDVPWLHVPMDELRRVRRIKRI